MTKQTYKIEYLNQTEFLGNIIKGQYILGTDLYIVAKGDEKYKLFKINEDYPDGKKIGEHKLGSELLEKIPHYWD